MSKHAKLILVASVCASLAPFAARAADNNGGSGRQPANAAIGSLAVNMGHALCNVAINSNGSIATTGAGSFVNPAQTLRVGVGTYQVAFRGPCGNVQAQNGWFRHVQPDTLTFGVLPLLVCTTADRAGNPSALFIRCYSQTGVAVDTSFMLSVSR